MKRIQAQGLESLFGLCTPPTQKKRKRERGGAKEHNISRKGLISFLSRKIKESKYTSESDRQLYIYGPEVYNSREIATFKLPR